MQLRALLEEWPGGGCEAPVKGVRSLLGKLLNLSEVVHPGTVFVRRILNQLGFGSFSVRDTDDRFPVPNGKRQGVTRLNREFHVDLEFWRLIMEMAGDGRGGRWYCSARVALVRVFRITPDPHIHQRHVRTFGHGHDGVGDDSAC